MTRISVVSPVYKAENIVDELIRRLRAALTDITADYEIVLVEDGGGDDSWQRITANAASDPKIKGVRLSRNWGQHHAITAGLDICSGDWVVVMDCDLQDRPEEIPRLYAEALRGFDMVFARRTERQDSLMKKFTSHLFYRLFSYLSGIQQDGTIGNFGICSRKVIEAVKTLREPMRAFSPMVRWVGFRKSAIDVVHAERFEGRSSYSWSRLFELALNIAVAYSEKPLKLVIKLGLFISAASALVTVCSLFVFLSPHRELSTNTMLLLSVWFLAGLIILLQGVIGLYVGKIFDGIKGRPIYLIDELVNVHDK